MTIVIVLLLLVLIIWASFSMFTRDSSSTDLGYLIEASEKLEIDGLPDFDLVESNQSKTVFVEGQVPIIHLCVRKPNGKPFDINTVMVALIHELTHLVHPDPGHGDRFNQIENSLLDKAERLGLISGADDIDPEYPCIT